MILEVIKFIRDEKESRPWASKSDIESALQHAFGVVKERSVFRLADGAVRISEANVGSFSNVVLSLSALKKYDDRPFVVVVVRPETVDFLLSNTTFLKKISHSSHQLRVDNIKGSFLGHDIMREFDGLTNAPKNFDTLYALHSQVSWQENVVRLVEATNAIAPTGVKFEPTATQRDVILGSPNLAAEILASDEYQRVEEELSATVRQRSAEILGAAALDNVNLRGNLIEQIITQAGNIHSLDDLGFHLGANIQLHVDIKTKLLDRSSSPKLYNIDKTLKFLARGNTALALLLVGIDVCKATVKTQLVSIFDPVIVRATRIQFHWAGRSSRGVTQLTGEVLACFNQDFEPSVDIAGSKSLLGGFLEL